MNEIKRDIFHSVAESILLVTKLRRPDIDTTLVHLCTCVTKSDKGYWRKLIHLMNYPRKIIGDVRIIVESIIEAFFAWADVVYDLHVDMKIHTGGTISFKNLTVKCRSIKQKINTKSST